MNDTKLDQAWAVRPRVKLLGQPIGLGIPLTLAGGYMTWNMLLAFSLQEPLWLQLSTIGLILAFGAMLVWGVSNLLAPFEKVWICPREVQLRLGSLVLRRIPVENIRSVSATTREVILKNKDTDLYRIKVNCLKGRSLWIDFMVDTEAALKEKLPGVTFLL